MRPSTAMRPSSPTITRPKTSNNNYGKIPIRQVSNIQPTDIQEIKLQTQQILHKTKILKSQIVKIDFMISSETKAVNKTFEQNSEKQNPSQVSKTTIDNITRSIDGAENRIKALQDEIETLSKDDRGAIVDELQEEVKIAYCEYQRLGKALADTKEVAQSYKAQLHEAESFANSIGRLRATVRELKALNSSLRDKSNAYQIKHEKLLIEKQINDNLKKKNNQRWRDKVELKEAEYNQRMKQICDELNNEADVHEQKIIELHEIIQNMCQKISDHLIGVDQPPSFQE